MRILNEVNACSIVVPLVACATNHMLEFMYVLRRAEHQGDRQGSAYSQ